MFATCRLTNVQEEFVAGPCAHNETHRLRPRVYCTHSVQYSYFLHTFVNPAYRKNLLIFFCVIPKWDISLPLHSVLSWAYRYLDFQSWYIAKDWLFFMKCAVKLHLLNTSTLSSIPVKRSKFRRCILIYSENITFGREHFLIPTMLNFICIEPDMLTV